MDSGGRTNVEVIVIGIYLISSRSNSFKNQSTQSKLKLEIDKIRNHQRKRNGGRYKTVGPEPGKNAKRKH